MVSCTSAKPQREATKKVQTSVRFAPQRYAYSCFFVGQGKGYFIFRSRLVIFVVFLTLRMQIVTITSDLGNQDYALGAFKGALLSAEPGVRLLDLTHQIPDFDLVETAYLIRNAWKHFPTGTIHLVWVHNHYDHAPQFIAVKHQDHYFIGPDNGILSLVIDTESAWEACQLEYEPGDNFSLRQLYAYAVAHLAAKKDFHQIGIPLAELKQRISLRPVAGTNDIRGTVIHTDGFGNVITNISRVLFEEVGLGRSFSVQAKRADAIRTIARHYSDAMYAEPVCLFNGAGLLEIAVYMDRADVLLNLHKGDPVAVLFDS